MLSSSQNSLHYRLPSPIMEVILPCKTPLVRFFMKRDDLIHPFVSGNKLRKLTPVLQVAKDQNKNILVTKGGGWSNHLLATAVAGAIEGFKTAAFVRGEENRALSANLLLAMQYGMQLIPTNRTDYRNDEALLQLTTQKFMNPFFIGEGGRGSLGEQGMHELLLEIEQLDSYSHLFTACGTGTTFWGLANHLKDTAIKLCGIAVLNNLPELQRNHSPEMLAARNLRLFAEFTMGGYAKVQPQLLKLMALFQQQNGILLDPVYTGKMLFAVCQLANQGFFAPHSRVLLLHTGGGLGTLGYAQAWEQSMHQTPNTHC